jgi:hypothetical protein
MLGWLGSLFDQAHDALRLVVDRAAHLNGWWIAAGVVLHVASQVIRTRAWFHIIVAALAPARGLTVADVTRAYLAGAGANAILPARGGDVLKLAIVRRRLPGASYATLATTLVAETVFESACGVALVIWALVRGFLPIPRIASEAPQPDVSLIISHPFLSSVVIAAVVGATGLVIGWLRRRGHELLERMRQGLAILGRPRAFVEHVVSWQALGRVVRLGSLACFMAAFGLPVTLTTALLVMAAQGGGRIIPLAPVSAGLRLAMLTYGLVEITDSAVDVAEITAFTFGVGAILFVVMLALALAALAREFGTASPRLALARARAGIPDAPA